MAGEGGVTPFCFGCVASLSGDVPAEGGSEMPEEMAAAVGVAAEATGLGDGGGEGDGGIDELPPLAPPRPLSRIERLGLRGPFSGYYLEVAARTAVRILRGQPRKEALSVKCWKHGGTCTWVIPMRRGPGDDPILQWWAEGEVLPPTAMPDQKRAAAARHVKAASHFKVDPDAS